MYIVLEYCNNGTFDDFISHKKMSETLAKFYFIQIKDGIEYLNKSGIFHRDLKPENILVHAGRGDDNDNHFILKICDFGFAKNLDNNILTTTICGSPLYMAPEILKRKSYTNNADIWIMFFLKCDFQFL